MYDDWAARRASGDQAADLITFTSAAHAPYTVTDTGMSRVLERAERLDVPIHIHLHETKAECDDSLSGMQA